MICICRDREISCNFVFVRYTSFGGKSQLLLNFLPTTPRPRLRLSRVALWHRDNWMLWHVLHVHACCVCVVCCVTVLCAYCLLRSLCVQHISRFHIPPSSQSPPCPCRSHNQIREVQTSDALKTAKTKHDKRPNTRVQTHTLRS